MNELKLPAAFKLPSGKVLKVVKIVDAKGAATTSEKLKPAITLAQCVDLNNEKSKPAITLAQCVDLNNDNSKDQCNHDSDEEDVDDAEDFPRVVSLPTVPEIRMNRLKMRLAESRKKCNRLHVQVTRLRKRLEILKEKKRKSVVGRKQVLEYVQKKLRGVKRSFVRAQLEEEGKNTGRRWGPEMLQFAAQLYNQNRQMYNSLADYLSLPTKNTLSRALQKSSNDNDSNLTEQLAEQLKLKRSHTGEIIQPTNS